MSADEEKRRKLEKGGHAGESVWTRSVVPTRYRAQHTRNLETRSLLFWLLGFEVN